MKRVVSVLLVITLILINASAVSERPDKISARSYIVMDTQYGRVLAENNADERMLIASTTKIMTAIVVAENCSDSQKVYIKPEYTGIEGSSMYLKAGETLTVRELLYGLLLASGNDAAVALACYVSGNTEAFAELMNEKAKSLGLSNSHFVNPHGLDHEEHYSCARDLAIITAELMKNKLLAEIVGTKTASVAGRNLKNHNKMLWNYQGAIGVKTGYTDHAGRSLVTCAQRDNACFICVTLGDPNDWVDHTALLDWAFENYKSREILNSENSCAEVPVISGIAEYVKVETTDLKTAALSNSDVVSYEMKLPKFVYAPVKKGDVLGSVAVTVNGDELLNVDLVAAETVESDSKIPLNFWERMKRSFGIASKMGYPYFGVYYIS